MDAAQSLGLLGSGLLAKVLSKLASRLGQVSVGMIRCVLEVSFKQVARPVDCVLYFVREVVKRAHWYSALWWVP